MAWISKFEQREGSGRVQPSKVTAFFKVFTPPDGSPIIQIDTHGSSDREIPGKVSQTLQLGKEAATELFDLLKQTYNFR